jgi:transposase
MGRKRRCFSREFKIQVLREVESGKSLAEASREHEIHANQIRQWQAQQRKYGERAFAGNGKIYTQEAQIAELERALGQMTMENRLLKKALTRHESRQTGGSGAL